jgi:signal transduction histidine kinase
MEIVSDRRKRFLLRFNSINRERVKNIFAILTQNKRKVFLSLFRGISFLVAILQTITTNIETQLSISSIVILVAIGVYTLLKIVMPFRWYKKDVLTYFVLASDLIICASLPFFTGGLSSGFLLYALNPILTIALVLKLPFALLAATLVASSVTISQLLGVSFHLPVIPELHTHTEYLGTLIILIMICYLSSILPYLVNDRIRTRIEAAAVIEERNRLAREMHDNLAQSVGYLKLKTRELQDTISFRALERVVIGLREMKIVIDGMYADIREALGLLRINTLNDQTLLVTISNFVSEFGKRTGIRTTLKLDSSELQLSNIAELHILRLLQEGLNNVRKHSKARSVEVRLENQDRGTVLSIKDDGIGFNLPEYLEQYDNSTHIGLKVMQERAAAVGGTMNILTTPGRGTTISFFIPSVSKVIENGTKNKINVS